MIFYLSARPFDVVIHGFLASWGVRERGRILPLTYQALFARRSHPPGIYIFADIELLDDAQRMQTAKIWEKLHACPADYRLLNHPQHTLRRTELLQTLRNAGINGFDVCAVGTRPAAFPVFLRKANDHFGARSDILTCQDQLDSEITRLRAAGTDLREWIVTGFCDTADAESIYRKYSAFIVAGKIIPRHILFGKHWLLKNAEQITHDNVTEELAFVKTNPHAQQLRAIFELAHVDYGRIDYAFHNGRLQVWEINTNPVLLHVDMLLPGPRSVVHAHFYQAFSNAICELGQTAARTGRTSRLERCRADVGTGIYRLGYWLRMHRIVHLAFWNTASGRLLKKIIKTVLGRV
jgi:hypothetical protein